MRHVSDEYEISNKIDNNVQQSSLDLLSKKPLKVNAYLGYKGKVIISGNVSSFRIGKEKMVKGLIINVGCHAT